MKHFLRVLSAIVLMMTLTVVGYAQGAKPPTAAPPRPVGFPQDAKPHDATASIEWWYFNAFLTSESGRKWAAVGSFFRVGLPGQKKGHYLIFSLADLESQERTAYSILDRQGYLLLRTIAEAQITLNPNDPRPYQLLALLTRSELPTPHQALKENARLKTSPLFSLTLENHLVSQESTDGRSWKVILNGDTWTLDLSMKQPERPPMLVGGKGMTGVNRPNEMYYLSLTRMEVEGTLTDDGAELPIKGVGWLDRQWGSPEFIQNYGWDWLGLQMEDGSDLILYRLRKISNGEIVKMEATTLTADGQTIVEKPTLFKRTGTWTDPMTRITFPSTFEISLPTSGYTLTVTPVFAQQTIPVIGIGDAIWEGVVDASGKNKAGEEVKGRGYLELVGYRKPKTPTKPK